METSFGFSRTRREREKKKKKHTFDSSFETQPETLLLLEMAGSISLDLSESVSSESTRKLFACSGTLRLLKASLRQQQP